MALFSHLHTPVSTDVAKRAHRSVGVEALLRGIVFHRLMPDAVTLIGGFILDVMQNPCGNTLIVQQLCHYVPTIFISFKNFQALTPSDYAGGAG